MKKIYLVAVGALLTAASTIPCFAEKQNDINEVKAEAIESFMFSSEGVNPIVLGVGLNSIPDSVSGLYQRFETEDDEGFCYIDFYDASGNVVLSAISTHGKITDVTAASPLFRTAQGVCVGMSVEQLKKLPGVEAEVDGSYYLNLVKLLVENGLVRYMTASKFL